LAYSCELGWLAHQHLYPINTCGILKGEIPPPNCYAGSRGNDKITVENRIVDKPWIGSIWREKTKIQEWHWLKTNNKFFVCLHGDKTYNSFVCGNTT
jgi:hypothetical protein